MIRWDSLSFCGPQWVSVGLSEVRWVSVGFYEGRWVSVGLGSSSVGFCVFLLFSMGFGGFR